MKLSEYPDWYNKRPPKTKKEFNWLWRRIANLERKVTELEKKLEEII